MFTEEMIAKAKKAASAEELMKLAGQEGITLTAEKAESYFAFLHNEGGIGDEMLEAVAGGKGKPNPKYYPGQKLWRYCNMTVNWLEMQITRVDIYNERDGYKYYYRALNLENQPELADYLDHKTVYTYDPRK